MCLSERSLSSLQVRPRCQTVSQAAVRSTNMAPAFFLASKESSMFFLSLKKSLKKSSKNPAEQLDPHLTSRVETQPALSREKGIDDWLNAGVDKPLEDLVGTQSRDIGR